MFHNVVHSIGSRTSVSGLRCIFAHWWSSLEWWWPWHSSCRFSASQCHWRRGSAARPRTPWLWQAGPAKMHVDNRQNADPYNLGNYWPAKLQGRGKSTRKCNRFQSCQDPFEKATNIFKPLQGRCLYGIQIVCQPDHQSLQSFPLVVSESSLVLSYSTLAFDQCRLQDDLLGHRSWKYCWISQGPCEDHRADEVDRANISLCDLKMSGNAYDEIAGNVRALAFQLIFRRLRAGKLGSKQRGAMLSGRMPSGDEAAPRNFQLSAKLSMTFIPSFLAVSITKSIASRASLLKLPGLAWEKTCFSISISKRLHTTCSYSNTHPQGIRRFQQNLSWQTNAYPMK